MNWSNYVVTLDVPGATEQVKAANRTRYVRAISKRDAEWRVTRQYILPEGAIITSIIRCN